MTAVLDDGGGRAKHIKESFEAFRREIDEYNDRRERLIKVSRDVTTASKRLIFQLHRYPHSAFVRSSQQEGAAARLVKDAVAKRDEVIGTILKAAQDEGLCGSEWSEDQKESSAARAQRHDRAYGPGLEEFIEAVTFLHFLQTGGQVMSLAQVQDLLRSSSQPNVFLTVTPQRYLLGISDLTGELMRFATNALGAGVEGQRIVTTVLRALRDIAGALDPFLPLVFGLRKKQTVTLQSLRKIEDLSYAVKVRTSEFSSDPTALQEMVKRALEGDGRRDDEVEGNE